jgi:hypothetical protein
MKAQRGSRGIALLFNLGARWGGWSTPRPGRFTAGKELRYPLYRRLGGPQDRSGRVWKISPPPGFEPRTFPAQSGSLYRIRYPGRKCTDTVQNWRNWWDCWEQWEIVEVGWLSVSNGTNSVFSTHGRNRVLCTRLLGKIHCRDQDTDGRKGLKLILQK